MVAGLTLLVSACGPGTPNPTTYPNTPTTAVPMAAPGAPYTCRPGPNEAVQGTFADASAIGWEGNGEGVVACLGGSFYVQGDVNRTYGFGVYDDSATTWTNLDGYLPALVTAFHRAGTDVSITNFGDEVMIGGRAYVAVYSRVSVHNPTTRALRVDPDRRPGSWHSTPHPSRSGRTRRSTTTTSSPSTASASPTPGRRVRRSPTPAASTSTWPTCGRSGTRSWPTITQLRLPDDRLVDAYRSGFIYTQIARSANHLNTGVNNYQSEYSHDVVGILANLFTQGDFADAHALLLDARNVVGSQGQYERRLVDLRLALGRVPDEDRRHRFRQGQLLHRWARGADRAEHRGRRPPHRGRPDGPGRDHGGDRRHRHRRATGPSTTTRPSWVWPPIATWPRAWGTHRRCVGHAAVRQPAGGDQYHPRRHHRPVPPRLPAVLHGGAQLGQPVRQPRGRQLGRAVALRAVGLGRRSFSAPRVTARASTSSTPPTPTASTAWRASSPPTPSAASPAYYYSSGYNAGYGSWGLASRTTGTRASWATSS